jgi:ribonucleoside-diphosphate reductase alpha chain
MAVNGDAIPVTDSQTPKTRKPSATAKAQAAATTAPATKGTDQPAGTATAAAQTAGTATAQPAGTATDQAAGTATDQAGGTATATAQTTPAATNPRHLAGPYGASFTGEGARGLTFERRWTRPDVHPYDEITWEYRTAGIANESGKSVFEQKDVEVPDFWSQLATNVVVSKYFRGHLGTPERETSVRQLIDRVVNTITAWAETQRYFATDADLKTFQAELTHLLVHQKMSFNSPVWFNVGIEPRPQCSACFINSVEDTMSSIMDLAKTEAMLFKFGSGAGSNLSTIRSSREKMAGGGTASGPVSFMKGYDAFAGVVKSGGKTRRAAKMVILDSSHPDIAEFIDSKAHEEQKAWALIEAGYDPSFTGEAYGSVFFQNANHSVRVTDEFMQAVVDDGQWQTRAVVAPHEVMDTYKARDIFHRMAEAAHLCGDPGIQYDTTINEWHTSANTDRIHASNPCSEYMFLNDTACNLASLNLMKFVGADGEFDVEAYRFAAKVTITAQEILVDNASYPTPRIEENSHKFRPLGLGYANLGALLMSRGLAYDSDEGRNYAAALTAIMHGEAYRQSAEIARDHGGPFFAYDENREPFLRVIGKHRDAAYQIVDGEHRRAGMEAATSAPSAGQAKLAAAARTVFDEALELGKENGYRNAQVTVLAPTGTIAFMMDCDTTGVEPDIALIKYKKLVGEGFLKIVNQTVPAALRKLGYGAEEVDEILAYLTEHETIEGAPHLKPQHLPVFDCAFKPANGERSIHYMGHVRMMGAIQPFISGAISKTVNMPEKATAEEIEKVYLEGWKLGLKAIAVYRDNSKRSQPLMTSKKSGDDAADPVDSEVVDKLRKQLAKAQVEAALPHRRRLPSERAAITHKFDIGGHEGYITVGLYPDGQPGEIFLKMAKEGSTVSGLMDTLATTISVALQYGVPLRDLVNKFAHVRFEPSGFTGNQEIPIAKSLVDYIFRWLGSRFLSPEDKANLGLQPAGGGDVPLGFGMPAASTTSAVPDANPAAPPTTEPAKTTDTDTPKATAVAAEPIKPTSGSAQATEPLSVIATNGTLANGHAANGNGKSNGGSTAPITLNLGATKVSFQTQADAPSCMDCGSIMVRNGSCYKCLNCGSTSGCS